MVRGCKAFLTALVLIAGCSIASAQEATIGAGKVEIGGFPGGGTFFTGGDDNTEVNFNVYTAGGDITYYINPKAAVEGEFTGSVGWAQDVFFKNKKVIAAAIVVIAAIIVLGQFTSAIENLDKFFRRVFIGQ